MKLTEILNELKDLLQELKYYETANNDDIDDARWNVECAIDNLQSAINREI